MEVMREIKILVTGDDGRTEVAALITQVLMKYGIRVKFASDDPMYQRAVGDENGVHVDMVRMANRKDLMICMDNFKDNPATKALEEQLKDAQKVIMDNLTELGLNVETPKETKE